MPLPNGVRREDSHGAEGPTPGELPYYENKNAINHVFGKSGHRLDDFLAGYGGNQTQAFDDIVNAAQQYVNKNSLTGVNTFTVNVNGTAIEVTGNVIDDVFRIGTAALPR